MTQQAKGKRIQHLLGLHKGLSEGLQGVGFWGFKVPISRPLLAQCFGFHPAQLLSAALRALGALAPALRSEAEDGGGGGGGSESGAFFSNTRVRVAIGTKKRP